MTTRVIDDWVLNVQNSIYNQTGRFPIIVQGITPEHDIQTFLRSEHQEIWFWYPGTEILPEYWELLGLTIDFRVMDYSVSTSRLISCGLGYHNHRRVPGVWIFRVEKVLRHSFSM